MDKERLADIQKAVLDLVRSPNYQPLKPKGIARRLQMTGDDANLVKQAVKKLVSSGLLVYRGGHQVELASGKTGEKRGKSGKSRGNLIQGTFRRRGSGNGVVRLAPDVAAELSFDEIHIPAEWAGDASSGDRVAVRLAKRRRGGARVSGQVVELLERQTSQFVGTYSERDGSGYVQVDGNVFARPIYVGDPGARNVQPDDKVVIEMLRFPNHYREGEAVIVEVLGPIGKPGVDTRSVMREFGLPDRFPDDVLEDARKQAELFEESIPEDRLDLTGETIITIDPADARDFDDAISLSRDENGFWRLGVHIADVAHFVQPKTPLDREAQKRSTSVYLPGRVVPMLPEVISNGLASLQPRKLRFAKTVFIEFSPEGARTHVDLHRSVIRSTRRLTYEQVDAFLEDPESWRRKLGGKVHDLLVGMRDLARILRSRRQQRGALELSMPELKVDLDRYDQVQGAHVVPYTESHQMIEEFMLSANEAVADRLQQQDWLFLRRVHQPPALRRLNQLHEFVQELGYDVDDLDNPFSLQRLLQAVRGTPHEYAVNYAVLRSLKRAAYSPAEEGHFALASDCYCHFTSPIRRYPDLTIHRLVDALILGEKPHIDPAALASLGDHCSEQERRAEMAERELTKLKLLRYLDERIGLEMDAVVTGVEKFGLFAQGLELPADGFIHVEALGDDYYQFDSASRTLTGRMHGKRLRLGDVIRVAVARVDLERRQLDFRFISTTAPAKRAAGSGKKTGKRSGKGKRPAGKTPGRKKRSQTKKAGGRKSAKKGASGRGKRQKTKRKSE